MIDVHSHILPGIDDGATDVKMTLEMLKNAVGEGIDKIIATPHFCRGYAEKSYREITILAEKVQSLAKEEGINIEIYNGQEVYYSQKIISDYKSGVIGTLANSKYLLFELSLQAEFDNEILENIYELQLLGIKPILAHPERYSFLKEEPYLINEFINEGILFQINSGSIEGKFGRKCRKTAALFLERGIYNFIGSDAHNSTNRMVAIRRGHELASSKNKIYSNLFEKSAESLLENRDVEFCGEKIKKKKIFGIFG